MLSLTINIRMAIPRLINGFVFLSCWSLVTRRCLLERLDLIFQVLFLSTSCFRTLLYRIIYERLKLYRIHVLLTAIAPVVMAKLKLQEYESSKAFTRLLS
jgi:hypothetical protein